MENKSDKLPPPPDSKNESISEFFAGFSSDLEEKYRSLLETIDEGFCAIKVLFDEKGDAVDYVFLEVNPAFERQTGLKSIISKRVREVVPDYENSWLEIYGEIALTGKPKRFARNSSRLDRIFDVYAFRISAPEERKVAVIFNDISKRKRIEEDLRKSIEQFQVFITTSSDSLYKMSADCTEIRSLQRTNFLDETAAPISEWFEKYIPSEDSHRIQSVINEAIAEKKPFELEHRFIRTDNSIGWTFSRAVPLLDAHGEIIEWFGTATDITEQKQTQNDLAFLAEISQELAKVNAPGKVIELIGAKVGEYLNLSFCAFAEIDESQNTAVVTRDWHRADLQSVSGVYNLSEFLNEDFQQTARAGRPFIVHDVTADPRVDTERYKELNIGAFVITPLIREGILKFLFVTNHERAHNWRADELALINELTTRIWTRLERLRAEQALRESEEKYRFIVNQAAVGISQSDQFGKFTFVNNRLCELLGYDCAELLEKGLKDVTHPEDYSANLQMFARNIKEKKSFQVEKRYIRKNGELIWVQNSVSPFYDSNGKLIFVQTVTLDITARKRAEEAVRKSEKQLQMVMESLKDYAIVTFDLEGKITRFNSGAENMFGYTEQEMIGQDGAILFTPEDRFKQIPQKEMQTALETGRAQNERWHLRKDGKRFYASGVMQLLHDGELEGFVKIARDETQRLITEKAESEKEMLRRLISSQEDERRRIARDIHDHFGQQMTALRLKLAKVKTMHYAASFLDEIKEAEEIAAHLDSDIDFIAWELRPSSLDDLGLRITLGNFLNEWSNHTGVKSEYHVVGVGERRFTYEIKTNLYRIAQEALNNIYKHAQADKVDVIFEKRGDELLLVIEDNGVGFDVENKDNRQKGIGLIGIHERAAIIGGAAEIESQKGVGTTVFARVPVKFEDES
jgi:PAS domain S-box-containing protein